MQDSNTVPASGTDSAANPPNALEAAKQKRNRAFYSYLLIWLTGLIFLFVERDDPDVKYHAAQSLVFFGGAAILSAILESLAATSPYLGFVYWLTGFIGLFSFIVWIYAMYRAWSDGGARFEIPFVKMLVTPAAERVAALA